MGKCGNNPRRPRNAGVSDARVASSISIIIGHNSAIFFLLNMEPFLFLIH